MSVVGAMTRHALSARLLLGALVLLANAAGLAPRSLHADDGCPRGGCEFPATTTTLQTADAWLQALLDDMRAVSLPFSGTAVLRGNAPAAGRLRATIWSTQVGGPGEALVAKGHTKIRRPGTFKLKLHPTRFGRVHEGGSFLDYTARLRIGDAVRERSNHYTPWGPSLRCCDFGSGGACRGGLDGNTCNRTMGGFPSDVRLDLVCDASGDCVSSPGEFGTCCDNVPSQPGMCGAPADSAACVAAGGTFHAASVCDKSGVCVSSTTTTTMSGTTSTTEPGCVQVVWDIPPGTSGGPGCFFAGGGTCTSIAQSCDDKDGVCTHLRPPECQLAFHPGTLRCKDGSYAQTCHCDVLSECQGTSTVAVGFTW